MAEHGRAAHRPVGAVLELGHDDRERVAADARDHAAVRDDLAHAVGDRAQQLVADALAEGLVDLVEPVEDDEEQGYGFDTLVDQAFLELVGEPAQVRQAGERVGVGQGGETLGLQGHLGGHAQHALVHDDDDEHRGDGRFEGVRLAAGQDLGDQDHGEGCDGDDDDHQLSSVVGHASGVQECRRGGPHDGRVQEARAEEDVRDHEDPVDEFGARLEPGQVGRGLEGQVCDGRDGDGCGEQAQRRRAAPPGAAQVGELDEEHHVADGVRGTDDAREQRVLGVPRGLDERDGEHEGHDDAEEQRVEDGAAVDPGLAGAGELPDADGDDDVPGEVDAVGDGGERVETAQLEHAAEQVAEDPQACAEGDHDPGPGREGPVGPQAHRDRQERGQGDDEAEGVSPQAHGHDGVDGDQYGATTQVPGPCVGLHVRLTSGTSAVPDAG